MKKINGYFESNFPIIELEINNNKISLILDTGFNGHLMLPKRIIEIMDLTQEGFIDYRTAEGSNNMSELYSVIVKIMDHIRKVPVIATDSNFSLAGIRLFNQFKIILEKNKNIVEISREK
jgi:predicted aspartyl protease